MIKDKNPKPVCKKWLNRPREHSASVGQNQLKGYSGPAQGCDTQSSGLKPVVTGVLTTTAGSSNAGGGLEERVCV